MVVTDLSDGLERVKMIGLPYPIIHMVEALSMDSGGFRWGRKVRAAGHFAVLTLR